MINAIELWQQGLKAIERALKDIDEGIITFKRKPKYVIVPFDRFDKLKVFELDMAYMKTMHNVKDGKYTSLKTSEDIDKHTVNLKQKRKNKPYTSDKDLFGVYEGDSDLSSNYKQKLDEILNEKYSL